MKLDSIENYFSKQESYFNHSVIRTARAAQNFAKAVTFIIAMQIFAPIAQTNSYIKRSFGLCSKTIRNLDISIDYHFTAADRFLSMSHELRGRLISQTLNSIDLFQDDKELIAKKGKKFFGDQWNVSAFSLEKRKEGICLGISVDIALKIFKKHMSIEEITKKYRFGAPIKAAFYQEDNESHISKKTWNQVFEDWKRKNSSYYRDRYKTESTMQKTKEKWLTRFGLNKQSIYKEEEETEIIKDLTEGIFQIAFTTEKCRHALTYIKNDEGQGILCDPNIGFFYCHRSEDAEIVFKEILKRYLPRKETGLRKIKVSALQSNS